LLPEKDRDELVHPRVREKQVRRVRQKGRGRHDGVLFLAKEIKKGLPDLRGIHGERHDYSADLQPHASSELAAAAARSLNARD
jgi:hypothetical protein